MHVQPIFFELLLWGHDIFFKKNATVKYESKDE